ncbi:bacillithiol biosynthesis cysteine-adding enzyme BshC [Phnomibacter sp. MR]|uniref:bacillithiol biosynthesis cysteine-adding enzyme BshC n=1 Tax=Phnomibacter sp. MR TaxID=3042318 RepID=UPI003A80A743
MKNFSTVAYSDTLAFSKLVNDYINGAETLQPFYEHAPTLDGIKNAIVQKAKHAVDRQLLVDTLRQQYKAFTLTKKQKANLENLLADNCFTITTAHQPNLFTGPLYFLYKIIHAIKLADSLQSDFPDQLFVPVFYMGSEDADLDELGHFYIDGEKRTWPTTQTGAVGRMKTKDIDPLIHQLAGQFLHLPHGQYMVNLLKDAYSKPTIQEATLHLVNSLFADYGLLVVVPDNAAFKRQFVSVIQQELKGGFSQPAVEATCSLLEQHYKLQVKGRPINMFYLDASGARERIEKVGDDFIVESLGLRWTEAEIITLTESHPECFSPNVILRGVLQETLLPNILFIGGGGELAYWLELKEVFAKAGVPYPVLLLRNSLLLLNEKQQGLQQKLALSDAEMFLPLQSLQDLLAAREGQLNNFDLAAEEQKLQEQYEHWQHVAGMIDVTLQSHVAALHTSAIKGLLGLHKKMKSAARRKLGEQGVQLIRLKKELFPTDNLQERIENAMPFLAQYGPDFLKDVYDASPVLNTTFTIVRL